MQHPGIRIPESSHSFFKIAQVNRTSHHVLGKWGYCSSACPLQELELTPTPQPTPKLTLIPTPIPTPTPGNYNFQLQQNQCYSHQFFLKYLNTLDGVSSCPTLDFPNSKVLRSSNPCVFPFKYRGKTWTHCTFGGVWIGKRWNWCSTQVYQINKE